MKTSLSKFLSHKVTPIALYLLLIVSVLGCNDDIIKTLNTVTTPTQPVKSAAKAITKFSFQQLSPAVVASINDSTKKITATVPPSTDVTKLIPSISVSAKAKVAPDSGKVQDFTNDVNYTVTAEDGTTAIYKVSISKTKSSAKELLRFSFDDFSPAVVGKIDATAKTITATVPATADLTKLKPTIKISDKATIAPATGTVTDFTKPVSFTITAEDGTKAVFVATVTKEVVASTSTFPATITYMSNPTSASKLTTLKCTWKNGVLTQTVSSVFNSFSGKDYIQTKNYTRDADGKITRIQGTYTGATNGDGTIDETYTYSTDRLTMTNKTSTNQYIRVFNSNGYFLNSEEKSVYSTKLTTNVVTLKGDDITSISINDSYGPSSYTLNTTYTGIKNPFFEITKQTQFLEVIFSDLWHVIPYSNVLIPTQSIYKDQYGSATNVFTYEVDNQNRVTRIVIKQGLATGQDMKFTY
jgi:hypothetical protein